MCSLNKDKADKKFQVIVPIWLIITAMILMAVAVFVFTLV